MYTLVYNIIFVYITCVLSCGPVWSYILILSLIFVNTYDTSLCYVSCIAFAVTGTFTSVFRAAVDTMLQAFCTGKIVLLYCYTILMYIYMSVYGS